MKRFNLTLIGIFISHLLSAQIPKPASPFIQGNTEPLLKNKQQFVIYDIGGDMTIGNVSFDYCVQNPGVNNRHYRMNFAIYNLKGQEIINLYQWHPKEVALNPHCWRVTLQFNKKIFLKKGQYYFAYCEQDIPPGETSTAILMVPNYNCKITGLNLADPPYYFFRNVDGDHQNPLPGNIPSSILTDLHDTNEFYSRDTSFTAFKFMLR